MYWENVTIVVLLFLLNAVDLQKVDVYQYDGNHYHYPSRNQRQHPPSYLYSRNGEYFHFYQGHDFIPQDPQPEPEPQYVRPLPQRPDRRPSYNQQPSYNQPPSYNHHHQVNTREDEVDRTFGEELRQLILSYVDKKYNMPNNDRNFYVQPPQQQPCRYQGQTGCRPTSTNKLNHQPAPSPDEDHFVHESHFPDFTEDNDKSPSQFDILQFGAQNEVDKPVARPNRMPMNDSEMMDMLTLTSVFFHGSKLDKKSKAEECELDPNVDIAKKVEWIFESSDTDTLLNRSCEFACEFEKMGLLRDNNVLNKGLLNLINIMYMELPSFRVISYMQRMLYCLEALGGYGDRCHTASKLLLCGFMKQSKIASCMRGFTTINGLRRCATENLFEDTFDGHTLDKLKWKPTIKISSVEDEEFVVYNTNPDNLYLDDGKLYIRPTLLDDETVASGTLNLKKCTGYYGSPECYRKAESFNILPPVMSAQITGTVYFQYGLVNIRAKLPEGDWIVPQIYLEPRSKEFGPLFNSGRVVLGKCNGNKYLMDENGNDISMKNVKSGVVLGSDRNIRFELGQMAASPNWHNEFHNFTLFWDEDGMTFSIDDQVVKVIGRTNKEPISDTLKFSKDEIISTWPERKRITPFDQEFRLMLGVSVGGNMEFPDNSVTSDNRKKPWVNHGSTKFLLNFWKDRHNWHKTWDPSKSALVVDHVKVTALK